jgi:hypothetical protein
MLLPMVFRSSNPETVMHVIHLRAVSCILLPVCDTRTTRFRGGSVRRPTEKYGGPRVPRR